MINRQGRIVCDDCGRFVAYADLQSGKALHDMRWEWDYFAEDVNEVGEYPLASSTLFGVEYGGKRGRYGKQGIAWLSVTALLDMYYITARLGGDNGVL